MADCVMPKVGELYKWKGEDAGHYLIKEVNDGHGNDNYYLQAIRIENGEDECILFNSINSHNYEKISG